MNKNAKEKAVRVVAAFAATVLLQGTGIPAKACYSVIVGKEASATGEVLLGHNEDNNDPLVMPQYKVPRQEFEPGAVLSLEKGMAAVPRSQSAPSYFWSETRRAAPGASFSDFFINEWGVAVISDNCPSREDAPELTDGGAAYAIRKAVSLEAKTARQGVELAIALVEKYGYNAPGRSYQIVDKKEGWMLQLVNGKQYVARRVGDREVAVIPNHYTIRQIDIKDRENYIVSPRLISYAMERGWYVPAKAGDWSDFDFARAYQTPQRYHHPANILRHQHGLAIITGQPAGKEDFPFAAVPQQKVGLETVKMVLRSHYEGTEDDLTAGYKQGSPHFTANRVICANTTQQSFIVQFRDNPDFTVIWNALGHPCTSPYVPWYLGIETVPQGYSWLEGAAAEKSHFAAAPSDYSYDNRREWWNSKDLQTAVEITYGDKAPGVQLKWKQLEDRFAQEQSGFEKRAAGLYRQDLAAGRQLLTEYTARQAAAAAVMTREQFKALGVKTLTVSGQALRQDEEALLTVRLAGDDTEIRSIEVGSLRLGSGFRSKSSDWALPIAAEVIQDGSGQSGLQAVFKAKDVLKYEVPRYADIWLTGKTQDGKTIIARGFVTILDGKKGEKMP